MASYKSKLVFSTYGKQDYCLTRSAPVGKKGIRKGEINSVIYELRQTTPIRLIHQE